MRFVGEAVAVVVAADRYAAEDAAGLIDVEYEPLTPVSDVEQALAADAPLVHEEWGDNVMQTLQAEIGEVAKAFQEADCVVSERLTTGRHMALPMETRGCVASFEPATDTLTVWSSTQVPHVLRSHIALVLDFPEHHIRVVAPDVGGGFGQKGHLFPEEAVSAYLTRAALADRSNGLKTAAKICPPRSTPNSKPSGPSLRSGRTAPSWASEAGCRRCGRGIPNTLGVCV